MIRAAWCSANPRARFHVPSSTSRATAEGTSPGRAEHAPGGDHISGRIADAGAAEVDHRADPAVADEHVGPEQIGVDPYRRARPRPALPGPGPRPRAAASLSMTVRAPTGWHSRVTASSSRSGRRPAARCASRVDAAQLDHEPGQISGARPARRGQDHPRTAGRRSTRRSPRRTGRCRPAGPVTPAPARGATGAGPATATTATPGADPEPTSRSAAAERRDRRRSGRSH